MFLIKINGYVFNNRFEGVFEHNKNLFQFPSTFIMGYNYYGITVFKYIYVIDSALKYAQLVLTVKFDEFFFPIQDK